MTNSLSLRGAKRRGNLGFSLAEIMVAVTILGISLLVIYGIYIKTYQASSRSELKTVASALAQEAIEGIINKPYSKIALWATSSPTPPSSYTFTNKNGSTSSETVIKTSSGSSSDYVTYQQQVTKLGQVFTITTLITWRDDANDSSGASDPDPNDYKRVHVSVGWSGGTTIVLDRFISMYYRPYATGIASADVGEFRRTDDSSYAKLGSASLSAYTGGNKTSKAESIGFSTDDYNENTNIKATAYADDDASTASPNEAYTDNKAVNYNNTAPIYFKSGASSSVSVNADAVENTLGSRGWHDGEFASEDIWPDWTPSGTWDSVSAWKLPSAIAKTTLSGGMYWDYLPAVPADQNFKLFQTGSAVAGSKVVITSTLATNKIGIRSWSKIDNVNIVEMPGQSSGVISADSIEALVETEANGTTGGAQVKVFNWKITNLRVVGYDPITFENQTKNYPLAGSEYPTLPAPISSISIGEKSSSVNDNGKQAEAQITAVLKVVINAQDFPQGGGAEPAWTISVPASTITLGAAQANVSFTTR